MRHHSGYDEPAACHWENVVSDIEVAQEDAVLQVRMNRIDKKNALTDAMYSALHEAMVRTEADDSIRALLLHGAGGNFTAGYDLREFLSAPPRGPDSAAFKFLAALVGMSKPVVAAVAGTAVGIGTTMLLHCDLVYADDSARFVLPFVGLGLCPEAGSSYLLPRMVGRACAAEMLLLGEPFDAARATALGLVCRVVPAGSLLDTAMSAARRLAALPPRSVRATKLLMRGGIERGLREVMQEELTTFAALLDSPDAKEAFSAFIEKRAPKFGQVENASATRR
jgi:enoyl-CoA hydratase/carnithine racemase